MNLKTLSLLMISLIAFAANSVLCRLALGEGKIDASSFTAIRLLSGAISLCVILLFSYRRQYRPFYRKGSWGGALFLFVYASAFSFAYITLSTGTGALILFAMVQITMIVVAACRGTRLSTIEIIGVLLAFAGIVYLLLPSISTPSVYGFLLMSVAGIAWGAYSIKGQGSASPLQDTAANFLRTVPAAIVLIIFFLADSHFTAEGVILAILSGSIASGVGYAIWYKVLPMLENSVAAVSQLSVPLLATAGGLIWVSEAITLRLAIATVFVVAGIFIVIRARQRQS